MTATSAKEFKAAVLKNLEFTRYKMNNYTLYTNKSKPELGYLISYSRKSYYNLGIADYTIPKDFSLAFDNPELLMRFGLGSSSFFVIEENLKGQQSWKTGEHYHGTEITIHENYFRDVIKPNFKDALDLDVFLKNYTYTYLPLEVTTIIRELQSLATENVLTSLYLEAKILECIAILMNEVTKSPENAFTNQINYGSINIGTNRTIKLTASDIRAIQKAHDILSNDYTNPPSIRALSKLVYLNEQKLKAGFSKQYHMSIGEYTNHIRMTTATNLLSTTDLSIETIAHKVGYHYSANFSKMFKNTYGKTPLKFRKTK